jgi:hypothetical protein
MMIIMMIIKYLFLMLIKINLEIRLIAYKHKHLYFFALFINKKIVSGYLSSCFK